jgi:hypothetical protein
MRERAGSRSRAGGRRVVLRRESEQDAAPGFRFGSHGTDRRSAAEGAEGVEWMETR